MKVLHLVFVGIVIICHGIQAGILYDKVKTNIFDNHPSDFESNVMESMKTTQSFFARDDVILVLSVGVIAAIEFAPFVKNFVKLAPLFSNVIEDKSDWSKKFTKSIANETAHSITESEIRWMAASIQTIRTEIKLLDKNNTDEENRKTIASIIHTELDKMVNFFDLQSSLLRKFPILGGPPLLQLAALVATFSPLAKTLIPYEAKNAPIACKMYDTLVVYRPLIVYARLHQLHTKGWISPELVKVLALPYNKDGYNRTNSGLIDCERDCSVNRPPTLDEHTACLKDTYGEDDFYVSEYTSPHCIEDYARLLRHRVENLFPIDLMNKLCERDPVKPTGSGWFTIILQNVYTYGKASGKTCQFVDTLGCNSYIRLIVNGEEVLKTEIEKGKFHYDVDKTFTTEKIPRKSTIKIEVWRSKSMASHQEKIILSTEGDVDSFLKQPIRTGAHFDRGDNRIETMSFWQDEYAENE